MNTIGGILLALLAGAIVWGMVRFLTPALKHPWGIRIFWITSVLGLMISSQIADPWNMAVMGFFGGSMIFEHICQRYLSKFIANMASKKETGSATPKKKRRTPKP